MKILITGADGFTGKHFVSYVKNLGIDFHALKADLNDRNALDNEVEKVNPTHVVHLAGISAVTHEIQSEFYEVNLLGTLNLLDALKKLVRVPLKILLASSANVYGNVGTAAIDESVAPSPQNHYAMSKLAMEYMARNYLDCLPLFLVRPFNYTGYGQSASFVIGKIAAHFKEQKREIELGRLDVAREYNDVRAVCEIYTRLLNKAECGEVYNICSGVTFELSEILNIFERIYGYKIHVHTNLKLVRNNEIKRLSGDPKKLETCIGKIKWPSIDETLRSMG